MLTHILENIRWISKSVRNLREILQVRSRIPMRWHTNWARKFLSLGKRHFRRIISFPFAQEIRTPRSRNFHNPWKALSQKTVRFPWHSSQRVTETKTSSSPVRAKISGSWAGNLSGDGLIPICNQNKTNTSWYYGDMTRIAFQIRDRVPVILEQSIALNANWYDRKISQTNPRIQQQLSRPQHRHQRAKRMVVDSCMFRSLHGPNLVFGQPRIWISFPNNMLTPEGYSSYSVAFQRILQFQQNHSLFGLGELYYSPSLQPSVPIPRFRSAFAQLRIS